MGGQETKSAGHEDVVAACLVPSHLTVTSGAECPVSVWTARGWKGDQAVAVRSADADTISRVGSEKATETTAPRWPV